MGYVRERTDSVTHLVKIIANEVFDDRLQRIKNSLSHYNGLKERIETLEKRIVLQEVTNNLQKAGESWSPVEDKLLRDSVDQAIDIIASAHGRTHVAIRSRIGQKELIK